MKRFLIFLLAACLLLVPLSGCRNSKNSSANDESTVGTTGDTIKDATAFSETPFENVQESDEPLNNDAVKALISSVPSNQYIAYASSFPLPIKATLYRGSEAISIDVYDARLVQLVNFYNHTIYHSQYSWSQGLLDLDFIEQNALGNDFRLELTFASVEGAALSSDVPALPGDTLIVTNQWFILMDHNRPGYEGAEEEYPFYAMLHLPLHHRYPWLDLFVF